MRGTSNAPLILGIIGSILMLPGVVCSVWIGGVFGSLSASGDGAGGAMSVGLGMIVGLVLGAIPIALGIAGAKKGKSSPDASFILLLLAGILAGVTWLRSAFTSLFCLVSLILFIVGAIIAKTQKKEAAE